MKKFRDKVSRLGNQEVETNNTGYRMFKFLFSVPADQLSADPQVGVSPLVAFLNDTMRLPDKPIVLKGKSDKGKSVAVYEKDKRNDALVAAKAIMTELKDIPITDKKKASDILKMFNVLTGPKGLDVERRNVEEVKNTAERKAALLKAAKGSAIFQIDIG